MRSRAVGRKIFRPYTSLVARNFKKTLQSRLQIAVSG